MECEFDNENENEKLYNIRRTTLELIEQLKKTKHSFEPKDLDDNVCIAQENVKNFRSRDVISIPFIYINSNEHYVDPSGKGTDIIDSNLRLINVDTLIGLVKDAATIAQTDNDHQVNLLKKFMDKLTFNDSTQEITTTVVKFLHQCVKIAKYLNVPDKYENVNTIGISFDEIREYITDPETHILVSANPVDDPKKSFGYQFYNQVPTEEIKVMIRKATNDTDLNRSQYYLAFFEKILTFHPGYFYYSWPQYVNLALFYMCLLSESNPIEGKGSNDLKGNMICYIIDIIVRSRVIQAWQKYPDTQTLLNDMIFNYPSKNYVITQLFMRRSSTERFKYFVSIIETYQELERFAQDLTKSNWYGQYLESLGQHIMKNLNGQNYYSLGTPCLMSTLQSLPDCESICKILDDSTML